MSRIGKLPINIPAGLDITISEGNDVKVKGPKGELSTKINSDMKVTIEDGVLIVERPSDRKDHRALHGLSRALINNMVVGVTDGFSKTLQIVGVGYRAALQGKKLVLSLGLSHPVEIEEPKGITFEVPDQTTIIISGTDKQAVGEVAATIRKRRPPEPYKGKGIRYKDEYVRRKVGKTGM
jgi:large subunit ribosomal protein L6